MTKSCAVLIAVLLSSAPSALADVIHLRNGRSLEGEVRDGRAASGSGAEADAGSVVFESGGLRMEIDRDEIASIDKAPTAAEVLAKKREALDEKDAEAHYRLALWAARERLREDAMALMKEAVLIDPDHAGARRALGHVKWEGRWRVEDELMRERGFVKDGREWISKEEADRREREAADGAAADGRAPRRSEDPRVIERERRRRLNDALRAIADEDASVRRKGEAALVDFAKATGNLDLEARAPELRGYYDRLHRELAAARATIEVRAQWVTLKRPIPTFSTSLGGFTSPVKLQLPEVSVVRINTTAVVPVQVVAPVRDDDPFRE